MIEMRRSIIMISTALLALQGHRARRDRAFTKSLAEYEPEFYQTIFLEYGEYDLLPKAVSRGIGEARFMAQRIR